MHNSAVRKLLLLAAAAALACSHKTVDKLRPCASDADCASGDLCASDKTCWTPPAAPPPPPLKPPGAPANVVDWIAPTYAELSWDAVKNADSYVILRHGVYPPQQLLVTTATRARIDLSAATTSGYYTIEARNAAGTGPDSAIFSLNPSTLTAQAAGAFDGVHVTWNSAYLTQFAVIERASGTGDFQQIASGVWQTLYVDPWPADGDYRYRVRIANGQGGVISNDALYTVKPGTAPQLSVSELANGVALTVQSLPSGPYQLRFWRGTSPTALQADSIYGGSPPTYIDYQPTAPDIDLYYQAEVSSTAARPARSAVVLIHTRPAAPAAAGADSGVNSVWVTWTGSAPAFRVSSYDPVTQAETPLADVTGASWQDTTVAAGATRYYAIRGLSSAGTSWQAIRATGHATPAADSINAGGSGLATRSIDSQHFVAQSFTAGQGGTLQQIEVDAAPANTVYNQVNAKIFQGGHLVRSAVLQSASKPPATVAPLDPSRVSTFFFIPSPPIPVSTGAQFTFRLEPAYYGFAATVGVTPDQYAGGSLLIDGIAQPQDLAFKSFILPAAGADNFALVASAGASAVGLTWPCHPAARRYLVMRADNGQPQAQVAQTLNCYYDDGPLSPGNYQYQVVADTCDACTLPKSTSASAAVVLRVDNALLASDGAVVTSSGLSQTLTAQSSGTLAGIELSAVMNGGTVYASITAGGKSFPVWPYWSGLDGCCSAPPLSAVATGPAFIDLRSGGIALSPGDTVRLDVSTQAQMLLGTAPATDTSGVLSVGGVAQPGRSLTYKLVLQ